MRISGGVLAGRTVNVPPGSIRPSMDRMRESVFAALGDISKKSFLDLFSGSGIIALEAASRGAAYVEAVEADRGKAKVLTANAALSPVLIHCRFMPAERYIKRARRRFDIIFCDPPFSYRYKTQLLGSIAASPLMTSMTQEPIMSSVTSGAELAGETYILIHRPKSETLSIETTGLGLKETRYYGNSAVDFFGRR